MEEEKKELNKIVDELQITVRKVQTGFLTIFTNSFGKDIIHHFATLEEALMGYADELFHPEKYVEKVKTEEGTAENPIIDTAKEASNEDTGGGVHLP